MNLSCVHILLTSPINSHYFDIGWVHRVYYSFLELQQIMPSKESCVNALGHIDNEKYVVIVSYAVQMPKPLATVSILIGHKRSFHSRLSCIAFFHLN